MNPRDTLEEAGDNAEAVKVEYITPRKSWPRAATPAEMRPAWAGEFADFDDWVNFATKRLTGTGDQYGQIPSICIDSLGRRCTIGAHFMRARDEGSFPVRFFWDMRPVCSTAEARIRELEGENKALLSALKPFMPITTHDTQDYAEVRFGEHQSQAMSLAPNDWQALTAAYDQALGGHS